MAGKEKHCRHFGTTCTVGMRATAKNVTGDTMSLSAAIRESFHLADFFFCWTVQSDKFSFFFFFVFFLPGVHFLSLKKKNISFTSFRFRFLAFSFFFQVSPITFDFILFIHYIFFIFFFLFFVCFFFVFSFLAFLYCFNFILFFFPFSIF